MEKYIKPECKIVEVVFEGNLMAGSEPMTPDPELGLNDEVSDNPMLAPKHKSIWDED